MEIKNKVILSLNNGLKKEFNTTCSLSNIKEKYNIGSLFIDGNLFSANIIESMTCYSLNSNIHIN